MRLRKPRASRRVDRGRTKRPDARPPLRFRLEAAQALRRLAGWVGRVQNVMMTSGRRPDDQGIRPYDHAMFFFDANRAKRILLRKNEIRARVLFEHFKLARILVGWRSSEDENLEIAICGLEPVTAPGGGMRCGGVWNVGERGPAGAKNLESGTFMACDPCNPLKSHKTAKAFFGKAWRKQPEIWKSLEKGLEAALIPPPPLRSAAAGCRCDRSAGRPCQETESTANA